MLSKYGWENTAQEVYLCHVGPDNIAGEVVTGSLVPFAGDKVESLEVYFKKMCS